MKKLLSSVLSAALVLSAMPMAITSAADSDLSYDVNLDGKVTGADAQLVLEYYAYTHKCGWSYSVELLDAVAEKGDITGDGFINATDAACIMTYIKETNLIGDVTGNGILQPTDASFILTYYMEAQSCYYEKIHSAFYDSDAVVYPCSLYFVGKPLYFRRKFRV